MKFILFLLFSLLLNSCVSNQNEPVQGTTESPLPNTLVQDGQNNNEIITKYDTILFNDRFIIIGNRDMKLDYFKRSDKNKKRESKGDTLFYDSKVVILGDRKYYTWVYVKYKSKYHFIDFEVDSIHTSELKLPELSSINEKFCNYLSVREWKSMIKSECLRQGVNFAGHFTIVDWGCGAMCQNMCIVDRLNGKVYFPDIPEDHIDGYYGVKFKVNSNMIITNAAILEDYAGYYLSEFNLYPQIYEWKDTLSIRLE